MKRHHFSLSLILLIVSAACARDPATFGSDPGEAVPLVRSAYTAERWNPKSSTIQTVEYFPDTPRKFLIVTFHRREGGTSKPYLYEGVPVHLWEAWRGAPSAGSWYHANLKGRYQFQSE